MFVIVATYRAKSSEEDAIIALHEDKIHERNFSPLYYHSWQLIRKADEPQEFISIAQFAHAELVEAATKNLAKDGWYSRLVSLMEDIPVHTNYNVVWSLH